MGSCIWNDVCNTESFETVYLYSVCDVVKHIPVFESTQSSFGTVLLGDVATHGTVPSVRRIILGDDVERGGAGLFSSPTATANAPVV